MARRISTSRTPSQPGAALREASQPAFQAARPEIESAAGEHARQFGAMVRERREAMRMRQDDLALATGVGRRFILELEAGKASCQLGRALVVAAAVGLRPLDLMSANNGDDDELLPQPADDADDLPALEDDDT
jgi:DNA-binding XRE family transcriptional regulator